MTTVSMNWLSYVQAIQNWRSAQYSLLLMVVRQLHWSAIHDESESPDSSASTLTLPTSPRPIHVPPLPDYRGAVADANSSNRSRDGRTGEWKGTVAGWGFEPDFPESQYDIDNDAGVYHPPSESCKKPTESADTEPYKGPQETIIVRHVTA